MFMFRQEKLSKQVLWLIVANLFTQATAYCLVAGAVELTEKTIYITWITRMTTDRWETKGLLGIAIIIDQVGLFGQLVD